MEQYQLAKELDFENLRFCIDNHVHTFLYIRDCGGVREDGEYHSRGMCKISEKLHGRNLDFRKDDSGLYMIVDKEDVFHFPLKHYFKGFSLAYERVRPERNGFCEMIMLGRGVEPYDPSLPEPRKSTLRTVLDDHLMEIDFEGRVDIKFHSWMDKPHWKTWTVG